MKAKRSTQFKQLLLIDETAQCYLDSLLFSFATSKMSIRSVRLVLRRLQALIDQYLELVPDGANEFSTPDEKSGEHLTP